MEPTTFPIFYLVDTILILYSQTTMAVDLKVQKLFLQLFTDGSCLITLFGKGGGVIFISLYFWIGFLFSAESLSYVLNFPKIFFCES